MSAQIIAACIVLAVMFLWTLINIAMSLVLWFSHQLIPGDKKILVYLVVYWLLIAAGLMFVATVVRPIGT